MKKFNTNIREYLEVLYQGETRKLAVRLMEELFQKWQNASEKTVQGLNERDCMLIVYGDSLNREGEMPIRTLKGFLERSGSGVITNVHLLPVFPYTSDDGFSVSDYEQIDPALGSWKDMEELAGGTGIMMDAVINHTSRSHIWFEKCCQGEFPYTQFYIACDKDADYSSVTRPRALPLLTEFQTVEGSQSFWTTFSGDQVDVNFQTPYLLREIAEVLLLYASRGARFLRLDAIGFAWKRLGTTCMHLKETHLLIRLLRCIVQEFYPGTMIITETNVPHSENISYFGNGDEAQLVYQFPLPPLTLFTMLTQDSGKLTEWARGLSNTPLPQGTTYFNFLASHDGIGVRPIDGILSSAEKDQLLEAVLDHGGRISDKQNPDGTKSPYELNINYLDAVTDLQEKNVEKKAARFLASQAVMLSLQGMPGIYYHSLLGSQNWQEGVEESGIPRRINRQKLDVAVLERELEDMGSLRHAVFEGYMHMLRIRGGQSAFSPYAGQKIMDYGRQIFALERRNEETGQRILALINISDHEISLEEYGRPAGTDLIRNSRFTQVSCLAPYQVVWLELEKEGED